MNEFKLIVAGGRDFLNYELLSRTLFAMADVEFADREVSIVSGLARGADALAVQFAQENHVVCHMFPANWGAFAKGAGFRRNSEMAKFSDGLLAFWDGKSKGTDHMIQTMQAASKPVIVVQY
jgi:hypothetical protein